MQALQKLNREAHAASDGAPPGQWRWNFGVYVYSEEVVPPATASRSSDRNDEESRT
jgi:hypothetical protein